LKDEEEKEEERKVVPGKERLVFVLASTRRPRPAGHVPRPHELKQPLKLFALLNLSEAETPNISRTFDTVPGKQV
jgi:hypothetical protein